MTSTILPQQIEKINSFFQKNEKKLFFIKRRIFLPLAKEIIKK